MDVFWTVYNFKGRVNPYFTYQPISQTQVAPIILPPPPCRNALYKNIVYTYRRYWGEEKRVKERNVRGVYFLGEIKNYEEPRDRIKP